MLRQIFLRSRERANCLKRDKYTCCDCGVKQSKKKDHVVKVCVHHINTIDEHWQKIIDLVYKYILCDVDELQTLCIDCHNKKD